MKQVGNIQCKYKIKSPQANLSIISDHDDWSIVPIDTQMIYPKPPWWKLKKRYGEKINDSLFSFLSFATTQPS